MKCNHPDRRAVPGRDLANFTLQGVIERTADGTGILLAHMPKFLTLLIHRRARDLVASDDPLDARGGAALLGHALDHLARGRVRARARARVGVRVGVGVGVRVRVRVRVRLRLRLRLRLRVKLGGRVRARARARVRARPPLGWSRRRRAPPARGPG